MFPPFRSSAIAALSIMALATWLLPFADPSNDEWTAYGRDPGGQRFSPLTQINRGRAATVKERSNPLKPNVELAA